jgi:adenine-specific DNA-methyltransferase
MVDTESMTLELVDSVPVDLDFSPLVRARTYPRIRYMGSKYKLLPTLHGVFSELGGETALDAFSGSGVVAYLLKAQGYTVTANDFMHFPATIARAAVENSTATLSLDLVEQICGPAADDRDFISTKFDGIFFAAEDRRFLDSAWSHIDQLSGHERDLATAALILSAARKQPRGVFTFTGTRYNDGRRDLALPMADHFRQHAAAYNATVFTNGREHTALCGDVAALDGRPYDMVYLDPPYAPPKDDADYMKRYHFLEGLSVYWRGQEIMEETKTKKIAKKFTPFAYKRTVEEALSKTFHQFQDSGAIVLSYSSNAVPGKDRIVELLSEVKPCVDVIAVDHSYSFGTHSTAQRNAVSEYVFVGRD